MLTIENQSGHRLPGLIERSFTFELRLLDDRGEIVSEGERTIDQRSYLPVEETVEIALAGSGATLELKAYHEAPGFRRPALFLERRFPLE